METKRVHARGVSFNLKVRGSGVPFLWTHGMTYSIAADEQAGLFDWGDLSDCATVVSYDARGHGETEASFDASEYTWPSLAEDALAIARSVAAHPCVAGGASMGAGVSLTAAVRHPEQVKGLVLVTPPAIWESRRAQGETYATMARLARWRMLSAVLPIVLRTRGILPDYVARAHPQMEARYRRAMSSLANPVYAALFGGASVSDLPPKDDVAAITAPTLILAWSGDPSHPISAALELKRLIVNARLEIADSMRDVREWPRLVRAFVQECARPEGGVGGRAG